MKIFYSLILLFNQIFGLNTARVAPDKTVAGNNSFYQLKAVTLGGDTVDFSSFKGKKVLIVNTASMCGYTPQYKELQELHEKHGDKVTVLAFPSNDFGEQEPGSKKEIQEFCSLEFGVTFTVFDKAVVKGGDKQEVYKWLTDKSLNGWNEEEPKWNFCKYIIDEQGKLTHFFSSGVSPVSKKILSIING